MGRLAGTAVARLATETLLPVAALGAAAERYENELFPTKRPPLWKDADRLGQ